MLEFISQAFTTLFVIIDPIGVGPIVLALTAQHTAAQRRKVAFTGAIVAFTILAIFGLAGNAILHAMGVGLPAFRIAGGLMLLLLAIDMLMERRTERREKRAEENDLLPDPSVFPLAIPLIAGPGAMAAMILLVGESENMLEKSSVFFVMGIVILMVVGVVLLANKIQHYIPPRGLSVVTRILGVLLSALAVQFILDGLADYGLSRVGG